MKNLILLAVMTLQCVFINAEALELTDLSIEYKYAIGTNRHWSIPEGEDKVGELNILIRQDSKWLFVSTNILTKLSNHQFRYGALEGKVGIKYKEHEFFLHHKSEHVLDYSVGRDYYNENSIGIKFKLN